MESLSSVYIIAAADHNHIGQVELALEMVQAAIEAKVNAIKFTKKTVSELATRRYLNQPYRIFPELGRTYREVWQHLELSPEDMKELSEACSGKIDFVLAPYDLPSLFCCDSLGVAAYKIDTFCNTNLALLEEIAQRDKPVFASTAVCDEQEILDIVRILGTNSLTLMHHSYTKSIRDKFIDLKWIRWLQKFGYKIGYSDQETTVIPNAVALGATVIEVSFTMDKNLPGENQATNLTPSELKDIVQEIRRTQKELSGELIKTIHPGETGFFDNQRISIVAKVSIPRGTIITPEMLALKAPPKGLTPRCLSYVVGKRALYDIQEDEAITFGLIDL